MAAAYEPPPASQRPPLPKPADLYVPSPLVLLLQQDGLQRHAAVIERNGFTLDDVGDLTNADLVEMGIAKLKERKQLLEAFNAHVQIEAGGGGGGGGAAASPPAAAENKYAWHTFTVDGASVHAMMMGEKYTFKWREWLNSTLELNMPKELRPSMTREVAEALVKVAVGRVPAHFATKFNDLAQSVIASRYYNQSQLAAASGGAAARAPAAATNKYAWRTFTVDGVSINAMMMGQKYTFKWREGLNSTLELNMPTELRPPLTRDVAEALIKLAVARVPAHFAKEFNDRAQSVIASRYYNWLPQSNGRLNAGLSLQSGHRRWHW